MSRTEAQIAADSAIDAPKPDHDPKPTPSPRTEAQKAASRANGLKGHGPRTPEGKAISRKNSYRHGMAGSGVVVRPVDSAEVERRGTAMMSEMAPKTDMGAYLVIRLAELTVLVESCTRQRHAATAIRVNNAIPGFDEARIAEVDRLISWIGQEPATSTRKLRSMPEGIDRMVAELLALVIALEAGRWDWFHGEQVAHLMGGRWMEVPVTRVRALSEAVVGKFDYLLPEDGAGLPVEERKSWARLALAKLIDGEMAALLESRKELDLESIEEERALAPDLALVDASKEGLLARRYEMAADRRVMKTLAELRWVEAEAQIKAEEAKAAPQPEPEAVRGPAGPGSSGSSRAGEARPASGPGHPAPADQNAASAAVRPTTEAAREGRNPANRDS